MMLRAVLLVVILSFLAIWATGALAEPVFRAEAESGTVITLHSEDCRLKAVENLKLRATWLEEGKIVEGCYGGHPAFPLVIFYFADKTVVVLPSEIFQRVRAKGI